MSFLRGVLAGLAIGYLTAPRSGKETRDKLTQRANDLQNQWEEGVSQIKSQFDQLVGTAETKVDQYASQAENKYNQYKNEAKATKDKAKADYNNAVDETANKAEYGIAKAEHDLKVG